ncbi:hypothetical protein BRC82_02010 [Halobacteriales archaeon QS_1_67_19]|nr:MAG: hypothetical protein BRC82_02010 [Halobacteriales archaeon QS_1_67_19]
MTNWYAVIVGFLAWLVIGAIGLTVPGFGQLTAGLLGGFLAGYVARGGFAGGAWHGLLAGSLGGIVFAIILGFGISVLGAPGLGPFAPLLGAGALVAVVSLALLFGLESALAGAVGGWLAAR